MKAGGIFGNSQLGADVGPTTSTIPVEIVANVDPLMVPCVSKEVVEDVQTLLGTRSTGAWRCPDAAALTKTGKTFKSFAPDCTGPTPTIPIGACTPNWDRGGPTTPPIRTEKAKTPATATGVLVVLGLAIAGLYALWPKKMKTNPRRKSRRVRKGARSR